jgi:hypothetical protein
MKSSRKILVWTGLVALLAGASVALIPPLLSDGQADYSHVVSIKDAREYQDPGLLQKAWALPVAMLYRSEIVFQRNASVIYDAMNTVDTAAQKRRGLLLIE